jgi:hypothetical protein
VGREHRLLLAHGVEGDRAVVGVDHDLHGVADVVETKPAHRLRIGERLGGGVGVLYPIEPAARHDHVRVAVEK